LDGLISRRIAEAEKTSDKEPEYWLERAQYFRGRHKQHMTFKIGVKKNGKITAEESRPKPGHNQFVGEQDTHHEHHGEPHAWLMAWLGVYWMATPGVRLADNALTGEPELGVRFINATHRDRRRIKEFVDHSREKQAATRNQGVRREDEEGEMEEGGEHAVEPAEPAAEQG
jgi:hypothetical protein